MNDVERARKIIREAIEAMRWDHSDGYPGVVDGKFTHGESLHVNAADATFLAGFVGVTLDEIVSNGTCDTCTHSEQGMERGYDMPCVKCLRPKHDLWKPKFSRRMIAAIEADRVIVTKKHMCKSGNAYMVYRGTHFWCGQCGAEVRA